MIAELLIAARPDSEEDAGFKIIACSEDLRWVLRADDIILGHSDAQFDVPGDLTRDELARKAIDTLRENQERIMAEAVRERALLQDKIDALLMLPHLED